MNQSDMLQRMCHAVLASTDIKAIVKSRGFPKSAVNPGILSGLFLTEQGLAEAFRALDRLEVGALHLLKWINKPVQVSFFERVYGERRGYGYTFTQKYQGVLAKVKERLVRTGVLLMTDVRSVHNETKMELWRFALPVQFHPFLPPLLESFRTFDGLGSSRSEVVREKLRSDLENAAAAASAMKDGIPCFQITEGELRLAELRFQASQVAGLQFALWRQQLAPQKSTSVSKDPNSPDPTNTAYQLLASLSDNQWADPEQIDDLVRVFTGQKVDCHALCDAGWQVGMLAKHEADGKSWFRPTPAEKVLAPHMYLEPLDQDQSVAVDLSTVPFAALEMLVKVSQVRQPTSGAARLHLTPDVVRMGRADRDVLASDETLWLFRHSQAFKQAHELLSSRQGKTMLHGNLLIARVTDLSLKVALEKLLGDSWFSLKNDYAVFPRSALSDVQRIVKKSGHVIKEVSGNER